MTDHDYSATELRCSARFHAARDCVLRGLFGVNWYKAGISLGLQSARELWHTRVETLREAGWEFAQGKRSAYLRNCPPFGVWADERPHLCKRPIICPFCYGRSFINTYQHLESCLFGDRHGRKLVVPRDSAFYVYRYYRCFTSDNPDWLWNGLPACLNAVKELCRDEPLRNCEQRHYPEHLGGFRWQRVTLGRRCVHYERVGALLVPSRPQWRPPPEFVLPAPGTYAWSWRRRLSRQGLNEFLPQLLRLPRGNLRADPQAVISLLIWLHHVRLVTHLGPAFQTSRSTDG